MSDPSYSFTADEARLAHDSWGCNCGPAALAMILGITLDQVRTAVDRVGFAERRYMNPTMMQKAIGIAGGRLIGIGNRIDREPAELNFPTCGLARIQWTGPWTAEGANLKWRYRQTHWVASWCSPTGLTVFDVNGGVRSFYDWEETIVPAILEACVPRADGGWYVTHSWEVTQ